MTFTERIAGAWLDAAEHADTQRMHTMQTQDTHTTPDAINLATQAERYEQQAQLVADLAEGETVAPLPTA